MHNIHVGRNQPLEALLAPVLLKMRRWGAKRTEWQSAATLSLALSEPEQDRFKAGAGQANSAEVCALA